MYICIHICNVFFILKEPSVAADPLVPNVSAIESSSTITLEHIAPEICPTSSLHCVVVPRSL